MEFTEVRSLYRDKETYLDKVITVGGWVKSVRDSKKFGFIVHRVYYSLIILSAKRPTGIFTSIRSIKEEVGGKKEIT